MNFYHVFILRLEQLIAYLYITNIQDYLISCCPYYPQEEDNNNTLTYSKY